jgi:hypothetical protein
MRRLFAAMLAALAASPAFADEITVNATQVDRFQGVGPGEAAGPLIFEGGLVLDSASDIFGGMSGIGFVSDDGHLVTVSDRGNFISGQLIYDEQRRPLSLVGVTTSPIQNTKGNDLPKGAAQDAEALSVVVRDGAPAAVRVGFENVTRVADFGLENGLPAGPARDLNIPDWLSRTRTNETLEAVCIAPPPSPVAGSTLLITEGVIDDDGQHSAFLLGVNDRGPLSYVSGATSNPTDCAFLPNGDLLVLERGVVLVSFVARLVRIKGADVKPGAHLEGEVLLEASGGDIDNMEGLAVHTGPAGETRITLIADDNFNDWERNLLLEFSLSQ